MIKQYIQIDVLNLENNKISELFASNFESCNMIKKIILSGNPIRTFDPNIFKNMKRLGNIQIDSGDDDQDQSHCWSTKGVGHISTESYTMSHSLLEQK